METIDNIKKNIELLKQHPNINIKDLSGDLKSAYENVKLAAELFYNTDLYANILNAVYTDEPNKYEENTVGSFLYGCQHLDADIELRCIPSCEESIQPKTDTCCNHQLWQMINGKLIKRNSVNSPSAYLIDDNFTGLSAEDMKILQDAGVKELKVINSKYKTILPSRPLNEVNIKIQSELHIHHQPQIIQQEPIFMDNVKFHVEDVKLLPEQESNSGWILWLIVIIIIIVVIICLIMYKKHSNKLSQYFQMHQ